MSIIIRWPRMMLADCWWHGGKSLATLFEEWRSLSLPATGTEDTEIWECSAGMKMASLVKADISCLTSSSIQIRNLLVVERPARQCPHHLLYANYQLCAWLGGLLGAWLLTHNCHRLGLTDTGEVTLCLRLSFISWLGQVRLLGPSMLCYVHMFRHDLQLSFCIQYCVVMRAASCGHDSRQD